MTKPKIEVLPIEQGATPDPNNINKHTQRGRGLHENSMRKRGAGRSIFSAGKGVETPVVMGGNQTLEIADQLGMEVINVHTTGKQIVNVVRDDIAPGSPEFYALAIEDNEVGKISYSPDIDIIAAIMADPAVKALKDEDKMLADIVDGMGGAIVKSLEELEAEYGGSLEDDFHAVIRIKVTPEIKARFDAVMVLMPGVNEMEKLDALISCGEQSNGI